MIPSRVFDPKSLPAPAPEIAEILARSIHLEMHGAGEGDGRAEAAAAQAGPLSRELVFHSRIRTESAARLLGLYHDFHASLSPVDRTALLSPGELQAAATDSYRVGLRDERQRQALGVHPISGVSALPSNPTDSGSLPSASEDPWPETPRLRASDLPLAEDDFGIPLDDIAGRLARSVNLEMRGAGECTARTEAAEKQSSQRHNGLRFHTRIRKEAAARCLALYEGVYAALPLSKQTACPTPARLKNAATLSYRMGLRDGRFAEKSAQALGSSPTAYNDALYEQLRRRARGQQRKFNR